MRTIWKLRRKFPTIWKGSFQIFPIPALASHIVIVDKKWKFECLEADVKNFRFSGLMRKVHRESYLAWKLDEQACGVARKLHENSPFRSAFPIRLFCTKLFHLMEKIQENFNCASSRASNFSMNFPMTAFPNHEEMLPAGEKWKHEI